MEQPFENENIVFMNEWFMKKVRMEYEHLQDPEKNANLSKHKEIEIQKRMEKEWIIFWRSYMHKGYFGNQIAKMHYVGYFTMLLITKKLA